MKNVKKLLSIVMVLTLVLSLGASALAATVTIDDPDGHLTDHTFKAYQIFSGTQNDESGNKLASVEWGSGINGAAFLEALKDEEAFDGAFEECETAADVAEALSEITSESDKAKVVAEIAADHLQGSGEEVKAGTENELAAGYYLIKDETAAASIGEGGAYNDVVLQVTKDITIKWKSDVPESEKKVKDRSDLDGNETDWQESADWDIGDDVPFLLSGTLPTNFSDYESYKLVFHDDQSEGLTFNSASVVVKVNGAEIKNTQEVTYYTVVTDGLDDGCEFEIVFNDMTKVPGATDSATITVEYTSKLDTDAVVGIVGNPNTMYMEYSNNAHGEGTGTTTPDKAIVFTFDFDVDKVDDEETPLEGAEFALYKQVPKDTDGAVALKDDGNPYDMGETVPDDAKYYIELKGDNALKMLDSKTDFYAKGLDDGNYMIVETVVPAGYNKAAAVLFTITAEHDKTSPESMKAKQLTVTGVGVNQTASGGYAKIVNKSGATLPETGGIGTTIFYIVGAVLVAGAVILLVTKKRVSGAEK